MEPIAEEDKEKRIRLLETKVRKQAKEIADLEQEVRTTRAQAKLHYDTVQNLLRYELKIENKEQKVVTGVVAGTNEKFTTA